MRPDVYWIDGVPCGRLAIMARPRAGDWLADEILGWRNAGINVVVSLLELHEVHELGLSREAELCLDHAIEFVAFPMPDRGVPDARQAASELARRLVEQIRVGKAVAIHCRAGIGRSALIAAYVLGLMGIESGAAFKFIGEARGVVVPDTKQQREWVHAALAVK